MTANAAEEITTLFAEAQAALLQAYAPYSKLRVGAALRAASGRIYSGCNVESMAYPLGGCAEHHAIAAAVRAEGPAFDLLDIAIAARQSNGAAAAIPPCGGCRQLILEFGAQARVHYLGPDGQIRDLGIEALLPDSFVLDGGAT